MAASAAAQSGSILGFALGGAGGTNAHGIGFLEAARALGVVPGVISCSSGMIVWVAEWLAGTPLAPRLEEQMRGEQRFPPPFDWMNAFWMSAFGDPGMLGPAVWDYWMRWMRPFGASDSREFFNRLFPSQVYVPNRPEEDFVRIAGIIGGSEIPVVFNSFHPASGRGYLHVNKAAKSFFGVTLGNVGGAEKYIPVTAETVKGALWLYNYGYEEDSPETLVDGACDRHFIIRELHGCDRIYIPRPVNTRYFGRLPHNYFENQDFTAEQWVNSDYTAETAGLRQINTLIQTGKLRDPGFKDVELVEIPVEHQFRPFNSLTEDRQLFDATFRESYKALSQHETRFTAAQGRRDGK